jgi:rhamnogalacturonyl hydrolase YesR
MNEPNPELSHGDTAGTALIVAAFYRYYLLYPSRINQWALDQADKAFKGVVDKIDESGWVTQVVDPDGTNGFLVYINLATPMQSPEAQAFSGMMWAARTAAGI